MPKGIPATSEIGCIRSACRREISASGLETLISDIVVSLLSGGQRTISLIAWFPDLVGMMFLMSRRNCARMDLSVEPTLGPVLERSWFYHIHWFI